MQIVHDRATAAACAAFTVSPAQLEAVASSAISAPSGDNCQPWKLELRASGFDVRFDPARGEALLDANGTASRMAIGAVLESARLRALELGLGLGFEIDPDPSDALLWVRATFKERRSVRAASLELAAALPARCTNRSLYEAAPLDEADRRALIEEARAPIGVHLLTDRAALAELALLAGTAEEIRTRTQRAFEDLQGWLRWTTEEVERTRDGLDVRTLELRAHERSALRLLRSWSLARVANALGAARMAGAWASRLIENSGAVGVLTAPSRSPADALAAGSSLQDVWLRATQRGLAFEPVAALPLLILAAEREGALEPKNRERMLGLEPRLRRLFSLSSSERPLLLFRVGRAPAPAVRSLRRSLAEVTA